MPHVLVRHDAYASSIATTFERVLADDVPTLHEPSADNPQRALQIVGLVAETIAGLAVGIVAGELERATRTWFDASTAAELRGLFDASIGGRVARPVSSRRFLPDADLRPIVDELGIRLRPRLRYVAADLAYAIERAYVRLRTPAMFAVLAEHSLLDERLRVELATGWACACAAIEGRPLPTIQGSARSRALWQAWSRLAGLERSVPDTYIARIAD
jgi:hypothetical protein